MSVKLLKDCAAILSTNPWPHEARILVESVGLYDGPEILYEGNMETAERVMACWNVQLGIGVKQIRRHSSLDQGKTDE